MTFGFRWEALSSISSVSKTTIISKTKDSLVAYKIENIAWEIWEIEEISANNWTKIIVKDLFFNTPARLNYLKKPRTEFLKIKEFLEHISLAYPEIAFELVHDWKIIFKFNHKETLKTRIYNIFWEEFYQNLLDINFSMPWMEVVWVISDPKISFANKTRQILFVNNRIIKSPLISKAISDAYNRYIPHSNNSWYVLNLKIDPTLIDVNVHPRKLEVRFAQEQQVFRVFYHAIEEKLQNVTLISNPISSEIEQNTISKTNISQENISQKKYYIPSGTKFKSYSPYKDTTINPSQTQIKQSLNFNKEILNSNDFDKQETFEKSLDLHDTPLGRIIGQMHNSYIIVETPFWMQILDQHALAERIIYEKLINTKKDFSTQWLLIWESIKLTTKELEIVEKYKEIFEEMWFEFEILDAWIVIISAIPDFIKKENIKNIFTWVIDDIWDQAFPASKTLEEVKNKIFAYTACRSAIKFWNKLSLFEINKLLNDAVLTYSSTCPHGRPVIYEISLDELKGKYER
jgi:DNA mismatch repair protein MutL